MSKNSNKLFMKYCKEICQKEKEDIVIVKSKYDLIIYVINNNKNINF